MTMRKCVLRGSMTECVVQKASFLSCLLDVAAGMGSGSRAGSLSHDGAPEGHIDESALASLARRTSRRTVKYVNISIIHVNIKILLNNFYL